jgi:drug/metabolite transporter (DMT)-like permease
MALSADDLADLRYARNLLENVSFAGRIANAVGTPIEKVFTVLPQGAAAAISAATNKALQAGLRFAISTMGDRNRSSVEWIHKSMVVVTGAAGGAFGQPINWGFRGPYLAALVQVLNSAGALSLVYAMRHGKAIIVAPLTSLSPVITVVLSLAVYSRVPPVYQVAGIVFAALAIYLMAE